jgi:cell division protein FtsZ
VDFADVRTVMSEMGMAMMGTGSACGEDRAREAAEAAIRSPLLEDIDLHGARGILVNVTAGPNLGIGEFAEVGETIESFASESATVVVGTVIDPEMTDEMRVTVVATGLGAPVSAPKVVVDNAPPQTTAEGGVDYDRPTVMRRAAASAPAERAQAPSPSADPDMDYLDIPAFIRRQAD